LTEKEYSYGSRKLGAKGFKKYCNSCQLDEKWKFRKKSCGEVEKIRTSLRKWAKTERGQEYYKTRGAENSNFMRLYSHSKEGIESRINARKKQSETMKKKIKSGEFTPCITNTWTHWDAKIKLNGKIKKYRSSWEASFAVCNPTLKYESIRIPYDNKIYIGDFYDEYSKILYEIKPRSSYNAQIKKITSVIEYCKNNGIEFKWINENNIEKYIDITLFSEYNLKQYIKMMAGIKYAKVKN
jgi:uncharacterized protein involved in high-affinity Fe2+ transport